MEKYKAESGRGLFQCRHGTGFNIKFRNSGTSQTKAKLGMIAQSEQHCRNWKQSTYGTAK